MISHHLKEDDGDRAVKLRLWSSTKRELMHFASRYAEEHVIGERASGAQGGGSRCRESEGLPEGARPQARVAGAPGNGRDARRRRAAQGLPREDRARKREGLT